MLGFNLLPRLKNVGSARLYRPAAGQDETWPNLASVLSTKTIDWDLIRQQYDQIVKYTTALRLGTAEAEQVLRRFTRGGPKTPPTARSRNSGVRCARRSSATTSPTRSYAARSTTGSRSWRTGTVPNHDLFYGKDGDLSGSDKESQEVSMPALHLLQSALVHVNTLLLQDILSKEKWQKRLTDADRRALSPLFWTHVNPYGRFELDMTNRLEPGPLAAPPAQRTDERQTATIQGIAGALEKRPFGTDVRRSRPSSVTGGGPTTCEYSSGRGNRAASAAQLLSAVRCRRP